MFDDDTHNHIGYTVKDTREQHDKTYRGCWNADIVGVKQSQNGAEHAEYKVASSIAASIGESGAPTQAFGLL